MKSIHVGAIFLLAALLGPGADAAPTEAVSGSQKRAAGDFIGAVASGGAPALAQVLPQSELDALRTELLARFREEDQRGGATLRKRLFGSASTLASVERQTSQSFFANLARRFELSARLVQDPEWLTAIRDGDNRAIVVLRGRAQDDKESPTVVQFVEIVADGKDWKPSIPGEIRAQLTELLQGRQRVRPLAATASATASAAGAGGVASDASGAGVGESTGEPAANPAAIVAMLRTAEEVLVAGKCDTYYRNYMSPGFRKSQSEKALDTLIKSCQRSIGMRELLISALRIVKQSAPQFEANGSRAVYDVSNQGLPFERFTLEYVDKRWYIAE